MRGTFVRPVWLWKISFSTGVGSRGSVPYPFLNIDAHKQNVCFTDSRIVLENSNLIFTNAQQTFLQSDSNTWIRTSANADKTGAVGSDAARYWLLQILHIAVLLFCVLRLKYILTKERLSSPTVSSSLSSRLSHVICSGVMVQHKLSLYNELIFSSKNCYLCDWLIRK